MPHKPLKHIRILEIGGYIAAPYATSLLCTLGAEVVKVERPGGGDPFRRDLNELSPYFIQYNAGKLSLGVDLKATEGIELIKALIPRFDVVLENLRPGKMDAIGLSHEECARLRPDLIYASVTGFGNGGPLQFRPAYDAIGQAFGGLNSILSDRGAAQLSGTCLADLITGVTNAAGILAALVGRATSGSGLRVETSMMEAVSTLTIDAVTQYVDSGHTDPTRRSRHFQAQNFCLKTSSGDEIAIHLSSSVKFWRGLIAAINRPELDDDPRFDTFAKRQENYDAIVAIVESEFLTKPAAEWERLLTEADVPFAPVLGVAGYIEHPQTKWLDVIEPEANGVALVRAPWRFDGVRPERAPAAPRVGQDTRKIASEVLDEVRIEELVACGVLFTDD